MTKEESEQAWSDHTYSFNAITAIECFKSSLKRDIEKRYKDKLEKGLSELSSTPIGTKTPLFTLDEFLELIETVEP